LEPPPRQIQGLNVVYVASIDDLRRHTEARGRVVADSLQGPAANLAICQVERDASFHLFGCDAEWRPVTDTWHQTLEEAFDRANLDYEGIGRTWQVHGCLYQKRS
jgi:hypothetical protein